MHFSLGGLWRLKIIYFYAWYQAPVNELIKTLILFQVGFKGFISLTHWWSSTPVRNMTWKAQENTPANAARSHPLQLAVGRLRPRNTPRIQRKSNTIETCKPVSSHRLLLSNHLPVKVMASSKFKQMPKSKVSNAESNNWKNWVLYASRN